MCSHPYFHLYWQNVSPPNPSSLPLESPPSSPRYASFFLFVFVSQDKASGNNYPSLSMPMGYSGDTKGGGKTAYDVLPPKPIKK